MCKRRCRSPFNNIKAFVCCHGLLQLSQLLVSAYFKSSLSTIERRYGLSSSTSGFISSVNEISNLLLIVFVSYFGGRLHRPRLIGTGGLLIGLAAFLSALPHFLTPPYAHGGGGAVVEAGVTGKPPVSGTGHSSAHSDLCRPSAMTSPLAPPPPRCPPASNVSGGGGARWLGAGPGVGAGHDADVRGRVVTMLMTSQLLLGVGAAPVQPLGISFVDDFASNANSPFYLGVLFAISVVGPALAFLLGSATLRYYVDFNRYPAGGPQGPPGVSLGDPEWIGAWWLGFLVAGASCVLSSLPYFLFPRHMVREELGFLVAGASCVLSSLPYFLFPRHMVREQEPGSLSDGHTTTDRLLKSPATAGGLQPPPLSLLQMMRAFPRKVLAVLVAPSFLLVVSAQACLSAIIAGLSTFLGKFLETQFGASASYANLLIGSLNLPGAALGILAGGVLMRRWCGGGGGGGVHVAALIAVVVLVVSLALSLPLPLLGCSSPPVAGVSVGFNGSSVEPAVLGSPRPSACHAACRCPWWPQARPGTAPVCSTWGVEFPSACLAGCVHRDSATGSFSSCSCVPGEAAARPGPCPSACPHLLIPVMALCSLAGLVACLAYTPGYILILRGVNSEDKSFAVGIQFLLLRLLAWLPAPALFGLLIDSSCLVWTESCHAVRGACKYYDNDALRTRYWSLQLALKFLALSLFSVVLVRVRRRRRRSLRAGAAAGAATTGATAGAAGGLPMGSLLSKAELGGEGARPLMAADDDGGVEDRSDHKE
uniref:Solute carrier organic anion transporter family member n=1 Tax=Petromyzon marinus TaxID=7757 RepID=A0AAJ7SLD3_PETMA|nr:solute carrier organic anion transporter family member 2A1 [Petromyzon marinus]